MSVSYQAFLTGKIARAVDNGFVVAPGEINALLKPHQRDIVQWAVQGGQRAIFAAFGLGKSMMQLEIIRLILSRAGGRGLIVCPLGVRQEFGVDAAKLGGTVRFVRRTAEVDTTDGIWITNYESIRDGRLDPALFAAVSLDEASVLRSFGSKTYQTFLTLFDAVPYRFVATATPSPNRFKELIHYAGFLGIMDTGQALTRFFQRDSTKANHLTLYPHKEREFWLWINTWAVFVQRPSDLGYSDDGYDLPPLDIRWQVDAHAFWRSSGNRHLTPDELAQLPPDQMSRLFTEQTLRETYDYESHVHVGDILHGAGSLPSTFMALAPGSWMPAVWTDVNRMLTLNTSQSQRQQQLKKEVEG